MKKYTLADLKHGIKPKSKVRRIDIDFKNLTQEEFDELNLEQYRNLKVLYCCGNKIEELGDYPKLESLYCFNNKLEHLGNYPKLLTLVCFDNEIRDLGTYPKLNYLNCSKNRLTELGYYPKLEHLVCCNNQIKELGDYPKLEHLVCYRNQITELGDYPTLISLYTGRTQLRQDNILYNVGVHNRTIYISPSSNKVGVGCFYGTAEELLEQSTKKYGDHNPYLEVISKMKEIQGGK